MISLINVTKEYHLDATTTITPIRDINLEINRGDFLMLVGRSGSGKTTLLNLCGGLVKPTSGQVLVDGANIQKLSDKKLSALRCQKIGFIFQFQSMLPNLNIIENVAMPATASRNVQRNIFKRAAELLIMVGLGERMKVYPKQLSAGELRRVAIARALMNQPEILFADEPTADLDDNTEASIVSLLQRIHKSGVTVVMITHSLDLIPYSTRAFKVEGGGLTPINREQYADRSLSAESILGMQSAPASEHDQSVLATDVKMQPSPQLLTVASNRRPNVHRVLVSLAVLGIVIGLFALGLELTRIINTPQTRPRADQPVVPSKSTTSVRDPNAGVSPDTPEMASVSPDNLAALQQYELLAVSFSAVMTFDFLGTSSSIADFPVKLNVPLVPIVWSEASFSGQLVEAVPGANFTYSVNGMVSADGSELRSLVVYSRQAMPGTSDDGILYRVSLQNLPLVSVLRKPDARLGTIEKSGAELQNNIANLEYIDGPLRYNQVAPVTTYDAANLTKSGAIPVLKLTFGKSGATLDKIGSH